MYVPSQPQCLRYVGDELILRLTGFQRCIIQVTVLHFPCLQMVFIHNKIKMMLEIKKISPEMQIDLCVSFFRVVCCLSYFCLPGK